MIQGLIETNLSYGYVHKYPTGEGNLWLVGRRGALTLKFPNNPYGQ